MDRSKAIRQSLDRCQLDGTIYARAVARELKYLHNEISLLRQMLERVRESVQPRWLNVEEKTIDSDTALGSILFEEEGWEAGQEHPADVIDSIFRPENYEDEPCGGCGKKPSVSAGHGSYICRKCHDNLPNRSK